VTLSGRRRDRFPFELCERSGDGERQTMRRDRVVGWLVAVFVVIAVVIPLVIPARAAHESTNTLTFAAPSGSGEASGIGTVTYHGGEVDTSRWTAQFRFTGLDSSKRYVVVVKGRFGEDESPEANAFTSLCSFQSDASGAGGCWWYHKVLRRIGIVQLRSGDEAGTVVLQATREPGGPGSITSVPNALSPTPTPNASPNSATPEGTPSPRVTGRRDQLHDIADDADWGARPALPSQRDESDSALLV